MSRWWVLACALAACGNQQICSPGGELTCTGPNGCNGTRVCNGDGTAFSVCECNGATGGVGGGVGGVGGAAGEGGSAGGGVGGSGGFPPDGGDGGGPNSCNPALDDSFMNGCQFDPSGQKCAATFPDPHGAAVLQCEPAGSVPAGGACSTVVTGKGVPLPGFDNCIDGFCTPFGVPSGEACARYCDLFTPCSGTDLCVFITQGAGGNVYGTCHAPCDPFAGPAQCPSGNSQAPNQVCSWAQIAGSPYMSGSCNLYNGTAQLGGFCNASANPPLNCAAGSICLGDDVCHALCDDSHPCAGGQTCTFARFPTQDTCDVGTGMGCVTPCPAPNVINCEECNRTTGQCFLVSSTQQYGGWCVSALPDAGP